MIDWKPLNTKPPEYRDLFLVSDGKEIRTAFLINETLFVGSGYHPRDVTDDLMWQPRPELPETPYDRRQRMVLVAQEQVNKITSRKYECFIEDHEPKPWTPGQCAGYAGPRLHLMRCKRKSGHGISGLFCRQHSWVER